MSRLIAVGLSLSSLFMSSQAQVSVGQWRDHFPYVHTHAITQSDEKVYCSAGPAVFSYGKKDHAIEKLSKVNGLSDVDISSLYYSSEYGVLMVGYSNGNLDLMGKNQTVNISDIKRYTQITGTKSIRHILVINDLAYLSCDFGIVVVNIPRNEIYDTYFIGEQGSTVEVYQTASDGSYLYAATGRGLLRASLSSLFLSNYESWTLVPGTPSHMKNFRFLSFYNGSIYGIHRGGMSQTDSLFKYTGSNWVFVSAVENETCHSMRVSRDQLIVCFSTSIRIFDASGNVIRTVDNQVIECNPQDALLDANNRLYMADGDQGLVREIQTGIFSPVAPNGPYTADVYYLTAYKGRIYAAAGGRDDTYNNIFKPGMFFLLSQEEWKSSFNYNVSDMVRILIDPADPEHMFAATWGFGVLEYSHGQLVNTFNASNSTLQSIIPGSDYVRIGGLDFDQEGNLWLTNSGVTNTVSVKHGDEWTGIPYPIDAETLGDILVTGSGSKWILLPRGYGLFAFNDKGTITNPDDDQFRKFSVYDENGKTITNDVFSMAEDLDGNLWVGTNQGPVVYYNPEEVFTGTNFYAQKIKIPGEEEGQANYLLGTETITSIAIDGANRKWFGTEGSGAYLFTEDGSREIYHFSEENSPLPSNNILSLCVDNKTGEVFFGTEKGIVSFRSTATEGGDDFNHVYVFPNPVREDYEGLIVVTGLVRNTTVKITDISGNLVYETQSLGGQATWDGTNLRGEKTHSGVYLVFCSNEDGSKTCVTKLLIIH